MIYSGIDPVAADLNGDGNVDLVLGAATGGLEDPYGIAVTFGNGGFTGVAPADSFPPNGYGLHNAVGNAWEWCADYFHASWHAGAGGMNPVGPPSGTTRVLKGGSFLCHESYCNRYRNAARIGNTPDTSTGHIAFRVARDL